MTELDTMPAPADRTSTDVAVPSTSHATLEAVRAWAHALQIIGESISPLVWTDIVPLHHWPLPRGFTLKSYPNPRLRHPDESEDDFARRAQSAGASASAVCMRSAELGIPMFVGLADIYNIHGKLGMMTKLRYAYAIGHGVRVWDVALDPERVTVAGIHPATGQEVEITVTMADAERGGWTSNDNYRRTPVDMLWSRAMGRLLDRVAGHVLMGVSSLDVLLDERTVEGEVVESATPGPARRVRTVADVTATPTVAPAAAADDAPAPAPLDRGTWDAINAEWKRLGVVGTGMRERRFRGISRLLVRADDPVTAGSDLSAAEGDIVLDTLRSIAADDAARIADVLGEDRPGDSEHVDMADADALHGPGGDVEDPPEHDPTTDPGFGQAGQS